MLHFEEIAESLTFGLIGNQNLSGYRDFLNLLERFGGDLILMDLYHGTNLAPSFREDMRERQRFACLARPPSRPCVR